MKVLIKQATIICTSSPFNGQVKDILVVDGLITSINDSINSAADTVIEQDGLCVSIGWMDMFAHFCDPGFEYRETLETGAKAAAAGGFTDVIILPNTKPVTDNKSQVEYIVQRSASLPTSIHAMGAVTKTAAGKELAEMYDMHLSGAIAFSDGTETIQNSALLLKALQYVKTIDAVVIQVPDDHQLNGNGLINEGIVSTRLGLPGKPSIAEELMVSRDIELALYTDSKIHFTGISSTKSIEHIKRAKAAGVKVSCSVTPYHLFFTDDDLVEYDTNLKVNPPLRTQADKESLLQALTDGTIDCIASHHIPYNYDNKVCEFEYAKNGMIGLETLFGVVWSVMNNVWTIEKLVETLSVAPRKLFGLAVPAIDENENACLTLFKPNEEYVFDAGMIRSKSVNTPFTGKKLKGKVVGTINGQHLFIN